MSDVGSGGPVAPTVAPDTDLPEPQNGATPVSDPTPAQIEAEGAETVQVEHNGESYTFPALVDELDGDAYDAFEDQRYSRGLRVVLSDEDWDRFKATKPKLKEYRALVNAWMAAVGVTSAGG